MIDEIGKEDRVSIKPNDILMSLDRLGFSHYNKTLEGYLRRK